MGQKVNNLLLTNFYKIKEPVSVCFLKIFSNDVEVVELDLKFFPFYFSGNNCFDINKKNLKLNQRLTNLQQTFIGTEMSKNNFKRTLCSRPIIFGAGRVVDKVKQPVRGDRAIGERMSYDLLEKVSKNKTQKQLKNVEKLSSTCLFWKKKSETRTYRVVRPMLGCSRAEITTLCQTWRLPVYPDQSNDFTQYSRNRIRKQLLPAIRFFFNPKVENVIFQFTEIVANEQSFINKKVEQLLTVLSLSNLSK